MALTKPHAKSYLGIIVNGDLAGITMYTSRRGHVVAFPKSPPLEPASFKQTMRRNKFRLAAATWRQQTRATKAKWTRAARLTHCVCHGYDLWVHWKTKATDRYIRTIQHQSGIQLLP